MKVCVAYASGGEYDDSWNSTIGIYKDMETAKRVIEEELTKLVGKSLTKLNEEKDAGAPYNRYSGLLTSKRNDYTEESHYLPFKLIWDKEIGQLIHDIKRYEEREEYCLRGYYTTEIELSLEEIIGT